MTQGIGFWPRLGEAGGRAAFALDDRLAARGVFQLLVNLQKF